MAEDNMLQLKTRTPDKDVVDLARDIFARAESGEIRSLATIADCGDSVIRKVSGTGHRYQMLGMLRMLEHELLCDLAAGTVQEDYIGDKD